MFFWSCALRTSLYILTNCSVQFLSLLFSLVKHLKLDDYLFISVVHRITEEAHKRKEDQIWGAGRAVSEARVESSLLTKGWQTGECSGPQWRLPKEITPDQKERFVGHKCWSILARSPGQGCCERPDTHDDRGLRCCPRVSKGVSQSHLFYIEMK